MTLDSSLHLESHRANTWWTVEDGTCVVQEGCRQGTLELVRHSWAEIQYGASSCLMTPRCSLSPTFYTALEYDFSYKGEDSKCFKLYEPHPSMVFAELLLSFFLLNNHLEIGNHF